MSSQVKSLSPRKELLKLQKCLFRKNASFIRNQTLIRRGEFDAYERAYKRKVAQYESVSNIGEVLEAIRASDIVYVGDYHTNSQSQRTFLRLLKLAVIEFPHIAVGLELLQKRHQKSLEAYLDKNLDEGEFLTKVQFEKYWGIDLWPSFLPIFDFARYHDLPVFGIEGVSDIMARLRFRDQKSAEIIAQFSKKHPKRKIFILVGDLHLAPRHLPGAVQKSLKKEKIRKKQLMIYQNSASIYWKLAEERLEQKVEVVKIDPENYCLINTPPTVWQQTYLHFIENEGEGIDFQDAQLSFMELVGQIANFLRLPLPKDVGDVEVFTSGDLSFLEKLKKEGHFSPHEIRIIKNQILHSQSYFIPKGRYVYLGSLSINHAAEEAAHYIKFLCSGEEFERNLLDAFYANILHECLGFFGSKIINHKRKCLHRKDFEKLIRFLRKKKRVTKEMALQLEAAKYIQAHYEIEKKGLPISNQKILRSDPPLFFAVTHALGYRLGDKLYYGMLNRVVSKNEIRKLFYDPFKGEGKPFQIYLKWSRRLRKVKIPERL